MALEAGLTEVEGQVVMQLFLLATDNEKWLNADSLKEMMRCAYCLRSPSFLHALIYRRRARPAGH